MITTKITIENYLAEYLIGKYVTPDKQGSPPAFRS